MRVLRWVLIVPAAIAAWYLALLIGLGLHGALNRLCPAEQMISGMCVAKWYRPAEDAVIAFGAALAAVLVVSVCTALAPAQKRLVAIVTFLVGAVVALVMAMAMASAQYGLMAAALVAGAVTLWVLLRRHRVDDKTAPG